MATWFATRRFYPGAGNHAERGSQIAGAWRQRTDKGRVRLVQDAGWSGGATRAASGGPGVAHGAEDVVVGLQAGRPCGSIALAEHDGAGVHPPPNHEGIGSGNRSGMRCGRAGHPRAAGPKRRLDRCRQPLQGTEASAATEPAVGRVRGTPARSGSRVITAFRAGVRGSPPGDRHLREGATGKLTGTRAARPLGNSAIGEVTGLFVIKPPGRRRHARIPCARDSVSGTGARGAGRARGRRKRPAIRRATPSAPPAPAGGPANPGRVRGPTEKGPARRAACLAARRSCRMHAPRTRYQ